MDRVITGLPLDFLFVVATSSYQIEGTRHGGCGPSHWDDFAAQPGRVSDGTDGALACDHYHRFAGDLDLVSDGGFSAYRFSFSWPRPPLFRGRLQHRGLAQLQCVALRIHRRLHVLHLAKKVLPGRGMPKYL